MHKHLNVYDNDSLEFIYQIYRFYFVRIHFIFAFSPYILVGSLKPLSFALSLSS